MPQHPVDDLMEDHRDIECVLGRFEQELAEAKPFPLEFVERSLEFLTEFADGFHHYKEEEWLFPALVHRGVAAEGGPVGMMLYEHATGRRLLRGIRENLAAAGENDPEAVAAVRSFAAEYTELLWEHIWKEDHVLFEMARRLLDEPTTLDLGGKFEKSCGMRLDAEGLAKHRRFAASQFKQGMQETASASSLAGGT